MYIYIYTYISLCLSLSICIVYNDFKSRADHLIMNISSSRSRRNGVVVTICLASSSSSSSKYYYIEERASGRKKLRFPCLSFVLESAGAYRSSSICPACRLPSRHIQEGTRWCAVLWLGSKGSTWHTKTSDIIEQYRALLIFSSYVTL
jgi:hypothetical protein